MKPYFMVFNQGERKIAVNMNQVCHMSPLADQTLIMFNVIIGGEPAHLLIDETYDSIIQRSDWPQQ